MLSSAPAAESRGMIAKAAAAARGSRSYRFFESAWMAFSHYLAAGAYSGSDTILLPAYIGWSPREGSGVFDPIAARAIHPVFYRMSGSLEIDVDHLRECIEQTSARALLIVHYFGYVDASYGRVLRLARDAGLEIIEDEAHAMLSDLIGGICGRESDVALYSLHKMLPVSAGGALVSNRDGGDSAAAAQIWRHDLAAIAARRRANARWLASAIAGLEDEVVPLRPVLREGEIPQTFPVCLKHADRNCVYREMNAAGFGVVSLYHTLIDAIEKRDFPASGLLASRILNLPVHQDVTVPDLECLVARLKQAL